MGLRWDDVHWAADCLRERVDSVASGFARNTSQEEASGRTVPNCVEADEQRADGMSFKEWNDAYTKLLQKRNKLERDVRDAWRDPEKQKKLQVKYEAAQKEATDWGNRDRDSGLVMRNLIR